MKSKYKKTFSNDWADYELIDAGNNKKLERWGNIITIRPERQAYFNSGMPQEEWYKSAHLEFISEGKQSGKWKVLQEIDKDDWKIKFKNLTFLLEPTKFKHVGLFPEQTTNWELISRYLTPEMKMLNLFAYTGAASIVGRSTGAEVTHIDSVKQSISWGKSNMESSDLDDIRWIQEDAFKFVQRELKRGNSYNLIIMDPPAWGIGANKEKWKIEQKLESLVEITSQLLADSGLLILNTYSPRISLEELESFGNKNFKTVETSELWKKTKTNKRLFFGHLMRAYK